MTADSAASVHSPRISGTDAAVNNRRGLWAQVVRGDEAETLSAVMPRSPSSPSEQPSFSDCSSSLPAPEPEAAAAETELSNSSDSSNSVGNGNVGRVKKAAWNKPSNGVVVEGSSPVMGAVSWPALSESTRPTPKSSSAESSSKTVVEVSVSPSQVPVIPQPPEKHSNRSNSHSNSNTNHHTHPGRSRSMKRGNGPPNFNRPQAPPPVQTIPRPPAPPPYPLFEMPYANMVPAVLEPRIREPTPYRVPRPMAGVVHDHPSHRNPSRRGNFGGGRPRGGDTSVYANGFGGRRDHHDREWHAPKSSGHHMAPPPPPLPRAFIRPPHPAPAPFMASQPMRPFVNPMGPYDMTPPFLYGPPLHTESYRGAPLLPHAPPPPRPSPMFVPPLSVRIVYQIEYYFSDANLDHDNFLRSNMDDEGWVPITLIAGFPRVREMTDDIQLILNSLRDSSVIELQGDKVRRRNDWRRWVQTSDRSSIDSSVQSPSGVAQTLPEENSFQNLTIDDAATTTQIVEDAGVSSVDPSQLANGEANTEASPSHI